ncbi:DUF4232 domain-containing protein [Streptomyces sp. NPDC004539]|uniref:DUF4232 domain-containing protein n=1 Tax=Streptomyces sp. NPDC004539 TaxID=3154280 RepID=UPI0033B435F6
MRRHLLLAPAVAALLTVTACGTEGTADAGAGGGSTPAPSASPVTDPGIDGARVTSVTLPAAPSPRADDDYVVRPDSLARLTAAYEIVNKDTEAMTYTVTISFRSSSGGAMSNQKVPARSVPPGKTVTGNLELLAGPGSGGATTAKVVKVDKIPTAEAPSEGGACPPSGVRVYADEGDAAMGLRVVGIHLVNCGTTPYSLDGFPELTLLDEEREPVDGVQILKGTSGISSAVGGGDTPEPLTLKPGAKARATLAWRNTTEFGTAVNVPYVRVRAKSGAAPVTISPGLDLGTTGKLGVSPWRTAAE